MGERPFLESAIAGADLIRTARCRMRDFMPPAMVRRSY